MGETIDQIEAHIDDARARLDSNLKELESRVSAATDWREQFRTRPYALLGMACVGGAVMAGVLRPRSRSRRGLAGAAMSPTKGPILGQAAASQTTEFVDTVKTALVALAANRVTEYISAALPGFEEHFRRARAEKGLQISAAPEANA